MRYAFLFAPLFGLSAAPLFLLPGEVPVVVWAGGGARVSMCPSFTPPLSPAVAAAVALARPPRPGPRNHRTGAAGMGRAPGGSRAGALPEPRGRAAQATAAAVGQLRPGGRAGAAAMAGQGRAGGGGTAPVWVLEPGFGNAAVRGFTEHRRRRVRCGRAAVRALVHAGPSCRAPAFLPFYGIGRSGGWAFCCFIFFQAGGAFCSAKAAEWSRGCATASCLQEEAGADGSGGEGTRSGCSERCLLLAPF